MYFRCCLMSLEYEMKIQSIVILSALDISTNVCLLTSGDREMFHSRLPETERIPLVIYEKLGMKI